MKPSVAVVWLSWSIVVLALIAAGAGLFWPAGGSPSAFTTLRGDTVTLYGQGIYRYDTAFKGAGARGSDVVTLALGVPLLALAAVRYRRGSPGGGLLLAGMLAYFLYIYASLALSIAYNDLFLIYIALFSASLFGFVLAYATVQPLAARFSDHLPRRAIAVFLFACGLLTSYVWLEPLLTALSQGGAPRLLESYTTMVTDVLDLGIIVPAVFLAGILLLQRNPQGYIIAFPLLVLLVMLGPVIAVQTALQLGAGVSFTPAEIAGPISGFLVLGMIAVWILAVLLRDCARAQE